eukprot:gene63-536_t
MPGILAIGDFGCQHIEQYMAEKGGTTPHPIDYMRIIKVASFGFFLGGPMLGKWYPFVETIVPKAIVAKKWPSVAFRVTMNQLVMGPFANSMFFGWIQGYDVLVESKRVYGKLTIGVEEVNEFFKRWAIKVKHDLLKTTYMSCCYFPPIRKRVFNFAVVPLDFRPLVAQFAIIGWSTYLSFQGHKQPTKIKRMKKIHIEKLKTKELEMKA